MKIDHDKASSGHYFGMTAWLEENVGALGIDYFYVPVLSESGRRTNLIKEIIFTNPKNELLCSLRWL
jgi:hypothetical protein